MSGTRQPPVGSSASVDPSADGRRTRTLVFVAGSFSPVAGGRTAATFLRSSLLGSAYRVSILTVDFKLDYERYFREWIARTDAPPSVRMENFYEALAGVPIYRTSRTKSFVPPRGAFRVDSTRWRRERPDGSAVDFFVRDDGSLYRRDVVRGGLVAVSERFASDGELRLKESTRAGRPSFRDYFAPGGRRFARTKVDDRGRERVRVEGGSFDTGRKFVLAMRLQRSWVAQLDRDEPGTVFIIDDRDQDRLFVDLGHRGAGNPPELQGKKIAVVHSTHLAAPYGDIHNVRPRNGNMLKRMEEFDAVVVLTQGQANDITEHFGERPLSVIPHPMSHVRARLRPSRAGKRLVVAARLVPVKRIDHMLRAFAIVVRDHPDAEFHIWGQGESLPDLEALARELRVADKVFFHGHTDNVPAALRTGDVSLSTSEREGIGLSTVEALSHGLPVVSYDYKYGPRDVLRSGKNGFLVPDGDVEALAGKISWLLSRPFRRRLMGLQAQAVRRRFHAKRVRREWLALLHRIG